MELPSIEMLLFQIIITAYASWWAISLGVKLGYLQYTGNRPGKDSEPTRPQYRHKNIGHGYEYPQLSPTRSAKSSATMTAPQPGSQTPAMIYNTMNLFSPFTYNTGEGEKNRPDEVSSKKRKQAEAAAWAREYPSIAEVNDIKLARMTEKYNKVRKENEQLRESRDYDVKENNRLNALVKSSAQDKVAIWGENRALREEMKQLQIKVHSTRTTDDFYHLINRKMNRSREEVEQMINVLSQGTLQDDIVAKIKGVDDVKGGLEVRIGQLEAEIVRVREEGEKEAERRVLEIMNEADRRMIIAYNQRHESSLKLHDTFLERVAEKEEIAVLKKGLERKERELREQKRLADKADQALDEKRLAHLEAVERWEGYKAGWEKNNRFFVRKLWHHTTRGQRQYWQQLCEEEGMDIGSVIQKLIQGCMDKDEVIGRIVDERDEERRRHGETRKRLGRSEMRYHEVRVGVGGRVSEVVSEGEEVSQEFDADALGWPADTDDEEGGEWESEGEWKEDKDAKEDEEEVKRGRKATVEEEDVRRGKKVTFEEEEEL